MDDINSISIAVVVIAFTIQNINDSVRKTASVLFLITQSSNFQLAKLRMGASRRRDSYLNGLRSQWTGHCSSPLTLHGTFWFIKKGVEKMNSQMDIR
jgi:hypothetical protein